MGNQIFGRDAKQQKKEREREKKRDEERGKDKKQQEEEDQGPLAKYQPMIRLFMQIFGMVVGAAGLAVSAAVLHQVHVPPVGENNMYQVTNCIALTAGSFIVNGTDGEIAIASGWIGNTCGYPVNADLLVKYTNTSTDEFNVTVVRFTNVTEPQALYYESEANVLITVQVLGQSRSQLSQQKSMSAVHCLNQLDLGDKGLYLRNNCYSPVLYSYYCNQDAFFPLQNSVLADTAVITPPVNSSCTYQLFTALQLLPF